MTALLEAKGLTVGYRTRRTERAVLQALDLKAAAGEMICLLGPNGTGKSTLMRTLARAQAPLAGTIRIAGTDIGPIPPTELAKHLAVVLTERMAIGAMPAYRLVELGRYPHVNWAGQLSEHDREIVADAISAVGATHLGERDINELSDGERQRFMIARALAQNPSVLLLDEPAAYLDVSGRVELIATLRRLAREKSIAVILSSHDLELSLRMADRIWLLDGAGGVRTGAPEDLIADGSVSAVFSGPNLAFSPIDRSFRIKTHPRGTAFVTGADTSRDLAVSALEREGFALAPSAELADIVVVANLDGWTAQRGERQAHGTVFADLAHFARHVENGHAP